MNSCEKLTVLLALVLPMCISEEMPDPHLIILGATGVGKSSLANVILGEEPDCNTCTFPVCTGGDSCTKETAYAVGNWVWDNGELFTVVDTPGFGDSDNDDNDLMNEMVGALKNVIKTANGFLLLFNGQNERFDTKAQQMIREMEALFGKGFWDHVVLGVSFWHYDFNSIQGRNYSGKTENWWKDEMNRQLKEKFHVEIELEAVFIDSWARQPWNLADFVQQEAFTRETAKLWDLFNSNSQFEFKTIQDVIEELAECQLENDCLNGEIQAELIRLANKDTELEVKNQKQDETIVNLEARNQEQDETIFNLEAKNQEQDETITNLEAKNKEQDETIASLEAKYEEQDETIANLEAKNQEQDETIANLESKNQEQDETIDNFDIFPLGTIIPWVNKPAVDALHQEELPDGWVLCDGSVISHGVWQGTHTPDLNSEGRFLRGGDPSQVLTLEDHLMQEHTHVDPGHSHVDAGHKHTDAGHIHTDAGHTHSHQKWSEVPGGCGAEGCNWHSLYVSATTGVSHADIQASSANIQSSAASIQPSTANLGGISSGNKGIETRPVNMRVIWILKAW